MSERPVPLTVTDRRSPVAPDPSLNAAGADEAEADSPETVAADPSVIDAERHATYRDGVEHATTLDRLSGGHKSCSTSPTPPAESCPGFATSAEAAAWAEGRLVPLTNAANREAIRQGRLSRWQEQR